MTLNQLKNFIIIFIHSFITIKIFIGCWILFLFQNSPEVDDEGYSIRPDDDTEGDILTVQIGFVYVIGYQFISVLVWRWCVSTTKHCVKRPNYTRSK